MTRCITKIAIADSRKEKVSVKNAAKQQGRMQILERRVSSVSRLNECIRCPSGCDGNESETSDGPID